MQQSEGAKNKTTGELLNDSEQVASSNNSGSLIAPSSLIRGARCSKKRLVSHKRIERCIKPVHPNDNNSNENNTQPIIDERELPGFGKNKSSINYWHYKETGVKSRPIKLIKHPIEHIERKIVITYLLGFLFKFIAIISGPIIVLAVLLTILPFIIIRRSVWFILNCSFISDARIKTCDYSDSYEKDCSVKTGNKEINWKYCPLNYLEAYWFKEKLVNNVILVVNQKGNEEFSIEKLRRLMKQNVLSKPEFRKFLSLVIARGIPYYKGYYWKYLDFQQDENNRHDFNTSEITDKSSASSAQSFQTIPKSEVSSSSHSSTTFASSDSQGDFKIQIPVDSKPTEDKEFFAIESHIYFDNSMRDVSNYKSTSIRQYAHKLLSQKLDLNRPLWEVRVVPTNKCRTYLIFRCHQSLADGKSLSNILTEHLTNLPLETVVVKQNQDDIETENENDLKLLKEKSSFIAKFSESNGFKSAALIGPLTIFLWIIWSVTRRKNNHLNRCRTGKIGISMDNVKRFYFTQYDLTKFFQIKQMTHSTVSDIILCALSGSLREYLRKFNAISNPPNLNISLTVDMSKTKLKDHTTNTYANRETKVPQVKCTLLNVPLPTSVEGAVPRLWELRNTMEELRASADPWVMIGLQKFLFTIMPLSWYQWLINRIALRNSSTIVSNIRGPQNMVESWCIDLFQKAMLESQQPSPIVQQDQMLCYQGKRAEAKACELIKKASEKFKLKNRLRLKGNSASVSEIYYCLQPPTSDIPISFNCITYQNKLFITVLSQSLLVEDSKLLSHLFFKQLNQLAHTIAKRKSLVTIVRTPVPIEIKCRVPSPSPNQQLIELEEAQSGKSNLKSGVLVQTKEINETNSESIRFGTFSHHSVKELLDENDVRRCKKCLQKDCICRRRKSLINLNNQRTQSPLVFAKQLIAPCSKILDGNKRYDTIETDECMCGLQLLQDLDEEHFDDECNDNKIVEGEMNEKQFESHINTRAYCKKCQPIAEQSAIKQIESSGPISILPTINNLRKQAEIHKSAQLYVPKVESGFYSRVQSKSETDLLPPGSRYRNNAQQTYSKESWFLLKKLAIFNKSNSINEKAKQNRSSLANINYDFQSRNLIELPAELFHRRYIERSKRRRSIATSIGISQSNRAVVVKDEMNADVSLRYQLDGPLSAIRGRRFSTMGNEVNPQRRASLIPFGFLHNQSFPKLFTEEGEAHL